MSFLLVLAVMVALALMGSRLFTIVGVATAMCFLMYTGEGVDSVTTLGRIVTKMESLTGKNVFLSIPFFIAAGAIMTKGGIAKRLTDLARALVGFVPGGLAVASIVACIVFAAISGSSPVTLVAVGAVMFPALIESGYPKRFSIGIIASAGSLGCMIPPAISMLIYTISVQGSAAVDPIDLYIAGILPALFIAGSLAVYSVIVGLSVPGSRQPFDGVELWRAFKGAAWALTLPAIVLGGIYGGVFTATEAGAVAFAASIVISCLVYGDVPLSRVPTLLAEAATLIGSLILIVVLAFGLNDVLAEMQVPDRIRDWVTAADLTAWQFLLLVNVLLIVLGALMDSISATLVFAPIFAPVAINHYGMDPIHFGIVFVVNMEIGYLAPPVATNLFVAAAIFRQPFLEVTKAIVPSLAIIIGALVVVMYVPTLSKAPLNLRDGVALYEPFPWDGKAEQVEVAEEGAPAEPAEEAGAKKPMTLEEMMKKAKENVAAEEANGSATEAAPEKKKPMTMEEMMKAAKAKVAEDDAKAAQDTDAP
jgi:C4-dicarboxylate transporter DctM subunit